MSDTTASAAARRQAGGRDLPIAIATGVGLAILFVGSVLWHPLPFTIVVFSLVAIGTVESAAILRRVGIHVAVPVVLLTDVVLMVGAYRSGHAGQIAGITTLFLASALWHLLLPHARADAFRRAAATVAFGMWLPFLASFAVLLARIPVEGDLAALGSIAAATVGDIAAFAVGTLFGRRRLAPSISPKKSWEGLIGGLVITTVLAVLVLPAMGNLYDVPTAALVAAACMLAGTVGDLFESAVKRSLGLKDLGALLAGHGGILDRVDGIIFALPVGFYVLTWLRG